jgi:hypothetical protein
VAIWYHWSPAAKGQATRAGAEIHVNLWRLRINKNSQKEETFLDIGLRLRDVSSIADFNLYLPFQLDRAHDVRDLGALLQNRGTLMAVFNEAYFPGDADALGTFSVMDTAHKEILCCHSLRPGIDFTVTPRSYDSQPGSVVHFDTQLCKRFRSQTDQYIRFRIMLDNARNAAFSRLERQTGLKQRFGESRVDLMAYGRTQWS